MAAMERVEDAGAKIGGARKDRWRDAAMTVADLADLNPEEAGRYVTKDLVWKVDYKALVEAGMPPMVAALVKLCRDRLAAKPSLNRTAAGTRGILRDADAVRRDYVTMMGKVRDVLEACRTPEDVAGAGRAIRSGIGALDMHGCPPAALDLLWSVFKDRSWPFDVGYDERKRATALLAEGWPGSSVPAWRKGVVVRDYGDGHFRALKGRSYVSKEHRSEQAALDEVREAWEAKAATRRAGPKVPDRPHLDVLERTGLPDLRGGRPVRSRDFVEVFGFKGVEFGNWVPQHERRRLMDLGYDALMDMARLFDLPPRAMSFGGTMSIAFGSRGEGGSAAHYEPDRRVTNLTRMSGAGSLAHEWGHGLDHMAGEIGQASPGRGQVRSGSGWYMRDGPRAKATEHLGPECSAAWGALMRTVHARPRTADERLADLEKRAAAQDRRAASLGKDLDDYRRDLPEGRRARKVERDMASSRDGAVAEAEALRAEAASVRSGADRGPHGTVRSDYFAEALKLSGPSGYYQRPTELLARAFECAVHDGLARAGGRSDYLVHGVEAERFEGAGWKGNPYPRGAEREALGEAVMTMVAAMRHHLVHLAETMPEPGADDMARADEALLAEGTPELPGTDGGAPIPDDADGEYAGISPGR